jgi:hypothetical protein
MKRVLGALGLLLVVAGTSSCLAVRPWERDVLARPDMQWQPDPLEAELRAHIAFSKEGALVGGGAGGGGCGCN